MFGDVFLIERDGQAPVRAERLAFGHTAGRNEAWLRDTLFAHPDLLPLRDIDPSFGPLIPLCTELQCKAGRSDIAFINPFGRLTLVECKLWRNREARREVVAQTLDYASMISRWSYSDLQRQVAAASRRRGNVPFECALAQNPGLSEQQFVDDTTRAMRAGRILLVIAGDGIREDVSGIAELINRNSASAYSFGLVEIALYGFGDSSLAIQPRVIAKTQIIERTVVLVREAGQPNAVIASEEPDPVTSTDISGDVLRNDLGESPMQAQYRAWWTPVIQTVFDDPDQEPPKLYWRDNVRTPLPWPTRVWLTAYRYGGDTGMIGVGTNGAEPGYSELMALLQSDKEGILQELPAGAAFQTFDGVRRVTLSIQRKAQECANDDEKRRWLSSTLNAYANALRPRLKALLQEQRLQQL